MRRQAGPGEEILVDVLDLGTVARVRTYGSAGINLPWSRLARYGESYDNSSEQRYDLRIRRTVVVEASTEPARSRGMVLRMGECVWIGRRCTR
ncbi:hypothetical protein [Streptomyces sp. NPDC059533]|uniref:hypothetical protein n=1 Tax=Streptomyces sp. NPDC059533 TaxID=3346858 RepID=UPI00368504C4